MSALAIAYAITGHLGLLLAIPPGYATAVWPPSGIAVAALLLWGRRLWPGVLVGSVLVNISTSWDGSTLESTLRSLGIAGSIAAGAAAQAAAGAWLIGRFVRERNIFLQEIGVVWLLLAGGPAACVINATVGTATLWTAGLVPGANILFNWWTWWVGDSIGVLIFAPLVLVWSVRPGSVWRRKQLFVTAPLVALFALVVALFFYSSSREEGRTRTGFNSEAGRFITQLTERGVDYANILQSLKGLYDSTGSVSREEFHIFASQLLGRLSGVRGLSWAERVTAGQRPAFVRGVRAEGEGGFDISELDASGRLVPALARPEYIALRHIEPLSIREAMGLDLLSEPKRRETLARARDSGTMQASSALTLILDAERQIGMLVVIPVYRHGAPVATPAERQQALQGFITAAVRTEDLLGNAFRMMDDGLEVRVTDRTDESSPQLLFTSPRWQAGTGGLSMVRTLNWAGREWSLEFQLPGTYLVAHRSWESWGLLATGLLLTGMLGMTLLVLAGRQAKVEELVAQQTTAIRFAEERFRGLLETAPDAMVIAGENGLIELVNAQAERMFGYPRDEMIGKPIELLIPERSRVRHATTRHEYVRNPRARGMGVGMDLAARRKDGSEISVEVSLSPLRSHGRMFVTAAVRDISQRKAAERRLAEQAESLARSNRDLEQFAYVASHDLQSPLRNVISFAQLLQRKFSEPLGEKGREYIATIVQGASQMQQLITDLLAFSRVGRSDAAFVPVNVEEVLAQVKYQLAAQIRERNAEITHDPLPTLPGTPLELLQVLQNLIGNAIKFNRPDSRPEVHVSATRQKDMWEFAVRDNGIGIKPEHRERIFQMFARLHDTGSYEGTGIGLAICQKIVHRHGGRIWVESEPGKGATFRFTLPAVAALPKTAAA